jgi:hypothetical protein
MGNKGWLKRALPFMATFALGIFIASFFVSVAPRSGFREHRFRRFEEMQQLRMERDQLRQENLRLRNKLNMNWDDPADSEDEFSASDGAVIRAVPPPPPPAPRMHR